MKMYAVTVRLKFSEKSFSTPFKTHWLKVPSPEELIKTISERFPGEQFKLMREDAERRIRNKCFSVDEDYLHRGN